MNARIVGAITRQKNCRRVQNGYGSFGPDIFVSVTYNSPAGPWGKVQPGFLGVVRTYPI